MKSDVDVRDCVILTFAVSRVCLFVIWDVILQIGRMSSRTLVPQITLPEAT